MKLFKKTTAVLALVTLVSGIFSTGASAYSTAQLEAANALAAEGVIVSHSDAADYNLDQNVLRQEIAAVSRGVAELSKKITCDGTFNDVTATTPNTWACYSIEALSDAGLIALNDNFRPEDNISKAEAVGMMVKAAYGDEYAYNSSMGTTWQEQVVDFAVEKGAVANFTNYDTSATRGFVFEVGASAMASEDVVSDDDLLEDLLGDLLGGDDDEEEDTTDEEEDEEDEGTDIVISGENVLEVTLSPESPDNGSVAAGVARTPVLAFDVTAGSEDVTLKEATLEFVGLGDSSDMDNLAFYIGNDKISKQSSRGFDNENEAELSFENDSVIKAGETKTITVTTTIDSGAADELQSLRVALVRLEASSDVEGDDLVGALLTPSLVTNKASVDINEETASDDIVVGESATLAGFELEEDSDKEDVIVKSVTFTVGGSVDAEDDITDLVLYADGEEIASNLYVNNDDEIIADLDFVIPADEKVEFELVGTITGSIGETIDIAFESDDDIYVVGATTGISLAVGGVGDVSGTDLQDIQTIEGSEINIAFDKSDIDEAKPNTEDVLVGTLVIDSVSDYTINELQVTVASNSATLINTMVADLELDGSGFDDVTGDGTATAVYVFEDINLNALEEIELALTVEIEDDTALNGEELEFTVKVMEIEDEENDVTYTDGGADDVTDVLSSNSFNSKTIDIESASFELSATNVTDRELVLGNGIDVVLYKGKISIGDSDTVTINDFNLVTSANHSLSGGADLEDVLDNVTLNIGGATFDGDVEAARVEFTSINADIEYGSDNVEVTVTATLQDDDAVNSADILELAFDTATLDIEDSEGEDLEAGNITLTAANTYNAELTLNEEGTFEIAVITGGENEDDIDSVVLAGTNSVALAEVEMEANDEDIKVKELAFEIIGGATAQVSTITMAGTDTATDGNGEVLTATITDAGGTATFTLTFADDADSTAATPTASAVTYDVTGTSAQTYTVAAGAGTTTVTADSPGVAITSIAVVTNSTDAADQISGAAAVTTPNVVAADFSSTLDDVKLMNGSQTLVEGAVVTYDVTKTTITFKDDFIVEEGDDKIEAVLVADLNIVTTEGGAISAALGDVQIDLVQQGATSSDIKGVSSNEDVNIDYTGDVTSEVVTVVPALVTVTIKQEFGTDENEAVIAFNIDKGNNELDDDDITVKTITFDAATTMGDIILLENDDNVTVTQGVVGQVMTLTAGNEISDNDEYTFTVSSAASSDKVKIEANGITFTIDGTTYTIVNDDPIDLDDYIKS